MPLPRLTVNLDGPTIQRGHILIDGHEIPGVTELDISIGCDRVTTATMSIFVGELEIDAQTLSILQANVKVTEPAAATQPDELDLRTFGEEPCHA